MNPPLIKENIKINRLSRNLLTDINKCRDYTKFIKLESKDLRRHKNNMRETFFLINALKRHKKKSKYCNDYGFAIYYDIWDTICIYIGFYNKTII